MGLIALLSASAPELREGSLAAGTRFETPFFQLDAAEPGPTVLVVAGIHGDERAPPEAAKTLRKLELTRGRLVVVPRANEHALAVGKRFTPGTRFLDLNRTFPTQKEREPRGRLGSDIWQFVKLHDPDWVLDLHEGFDFNRRNRKSVGSSVTYVAHSKVGACSERLARHVAGSINARIRQRSKHFTVLSPGPNASLARSVAETLGIPSLVFETTRIGQPLRLRVTQHEVMLDSTLRKLGLVGNAGADPCAAPTTV
jgi:predicted deacylase